MIYVTVGTAVKGIDFTRLLREMDRLAGELGVDVLIQRGPADYEPQHARHVRYVSFDEALRLFREADFVVGHCGTGTVLNALRFEKPAILVPRRRESGELERDDHQVEMADRIRGTPGLYVIDEIADLEPMVRALLASPGAGPKPGPRRAELIDAVRDFLDTPGAGAASVAP